MTILEHPFKPYIKTKGEETLFLFDYQNESIHVVLGDIFYLSKEDRYVMFTPISKKEYFSIDDFAFVALQFKKQWNGVTELVYSHRKMYKFQDVVYDYHYIDQMTYLGNIFIHDDIENRVLQEEKKYKKRLISLNTLKESLYDKKSILYNSLEFGLFFKDEDHDIALVFNPKKNTVKKLFESHLEFFHYHSRILASKMTFSFNFCYLGYIYHLEESYLDMLPNKFKTAIFLYDDKNGFCMFSDVKPGHLYPIPKKEPLSLTLYHFHHKSEKKYNKLFLSII